MMTRRIALGAIGAAGASASVSAAGKQEKAGHFDGVDPQGDDLWADVKTYADMGDHRTGALADRQCLAWMSEHFSRLGYRVETPSFAYQHVETREALVEVGSQAANLMPLWPAHFAPDAISAQVAITPWDAPGEIEGRIAIARAPFMRSASVFDPAFERPLRALLAGRPAVLIIATEGPTGGLIAQNVSPRTAPYPCPTALIAPSDLDRLAPSGVARVTLRGTTAPATAHNVVAVHGQGPRQIVISTPISGWFRCAAERGPGIALQRALARRWMELPDRLRRDATLHLLATSGHELGGIGAHAWLKSHAPKPEDTHFWLHLGAGIAAYPWRQTPTGLRRMLGGPDATRLLMVSDRRDLAAASAAFAGQPSYEQPRLVAPGEAVGETAIWMRAGYRRVAGFAAAHSFHHVPGDGPETTGPELLAPAARACAELIMSVLVSA